MSAKQDEMIKKIVIERLKSMSPHVKIALGSKTGFLTRDQMLQEVSQDSDIGKRIIEIQVKYLRALKEGLI